MFSSCHSNAYQVCLQPFFDAWFGGAQEVTVEVKSNLASGARMANQKKYVHGVIKRLSFSS